MKAQLGCLRYLGRCTQMAAIDDLRVPNRDAAFRLRQLPTHIASFSSAITNV